MKESLRIKLNNLIRLKGYITSYEMENFCKRENKKISNGERRLRSSESPNVIKVYEHGVIVGYQWSEKETAPPSPTLLPMNEKVRAWNAQFYPKEVKAINTLF